MTELAISYTDETASTTAGLTPGITDLSQPLGQVPGDLPEFERAKVSATEIKISGACAIDTHGELKVSLDDLIRAVGVFRVVKVNHYVNKAGDVVRQQVLAPVEDLIVVPFDAANPADDGIVRARP
jgi:hypothetical protein